MGLGGAVLALIAGRQATALWSVRQLWPTLVLSALAVVVYPLAFYTGMDLAGVAVGNVLTLGSGPLVGAALEWLIDRRAPRLNWWWALGFGLVGAIALTLSDSSGTSADPDRFGLGVVVALVAGVAYGGFSYGLGRLMSQGATPLSATGAVFGAAALPLLVLLAFGAPVVLGAGSALWGVGYLVAGPMVASYLLYSRGLRVLPASRVLVIALVEPAVATVLAIAVVGERFGPLGGLGLVAIGVAVWLAGRSGPMRQVGSKP